MVQQADAKPGRKVRPGFQTWTPRRGRADSPIEEEAGSDSALDAAKAAAAAALGAAQAQGKDASGKQMKLHNPAPDLRTSMCSFDPLRGVICDLT